MSLRSSRDNFLYQIEESLKNLREELSKTHSVLLSMPSGVAQNAVDIVNVVSMFFRGEIYVYADESFGACDIPIDAAKRIGCGAILHFAHIPFFTSAKSVIDDIKIFYIPVFVEQDANKIAQHLVPYLSLYKSVSLHAPLHYAKILPSLKAKIEEIYGNSLRVYLKRGNSLLLPGQVLGCDVSSFHENAEAAVYIGDGRFHAYALVKYLPLEVDIVAYYIGEERVEVYTKEEREKIKRKYYAVYSLINDASRLGFVVSIKYGQYRKFGSLLRSAYEKFKRKGKEIHFFVADKIDPVHINAFCRKVDAILNFSCPRLEDDSELFSIPMMSYSTYLTIEKELSS